MKYKAIEKTLDECFHWMRSFALAVDGQKATINYEFSWDHEKTVEDKSQILEDP